MATKKVTSTKSTAVKATAKSITINFQKPGSLPEKMKVPADSTVADLCKELALDGYVISVNGNTAETSTVLTKDAVVRVGIKTKNNR